MFHGELVHRSIVTNSHGEVTDVENTVVLFHHQGLVVLVRQLCGGRVNRRKHVLVITCRLWSGIRRLRHWRGRGRWRTYHTRGRRCVFGTVRWRCRRTHVEGSFSAWGRNKKCDGRTILCSEIQKGREETRIFNFENSDYKTKGRILKSHVPFKIFFTRVLF